MKLFDLRISLRIIGVTLLVYILWHVDVGDVVASLVKVHVLYFLLALFLLMLASLIGALKWKILVRAQQIQLPLWALVKYYFIGMFLGMVTPGKIGEFWRARYLVGANGMQTSRAMSTVFIDRGVDTLIIGFVGIGALAHMFVFPMNAFWWSVSALSFLVGFVYLLYRFWNAGFVQGAISFFWKSILFLFRRKQDSRLMLGVKATGIFRSAFSIRIWSYGILYYVLTVVAYYALILSLSLSVPFFYLFLIVGLVNLVLIVPITILGLGTRETSYIVLLGAVGIASADAVAFSTLVLVSGMIVSIPGGFLFLKNVT